MKSQWLKFAATTLAVAVILVAPLSASAAVDMFLKLDGIKGESTDRTHQDEIDVLAWSWGESSGTARTRKGMVPLACIQDLVVTKNIDAASPRLIMSAVNGDVIRDAVLTVRSAGERPLEFLVITMTNVMITSYQTGGSSGADRPTEQVTLNFERMVGRYTKQKADGSAGETVLWDISGANSRGCQR